MMELKENIVRKEQAEQIMHGRLLHMATSVVIKVGICCHHSHTNYFRCNYCIVFCLCLLLMLPFPSLPVQNKSDGENFALWEEPYKQARKWKPCAAKHSYPDEGYTLFKEIQIVTVPP